MSSHKSHLRNEEEQVARQESTTEKSGTLASGTITNVGHVVPVGKVRVGYRSVDVATPREWEETYWQRRRQRDR